MPISRHNAHCHHLKSDEAGFSLLEILIVLAIMGLMISLVSPRLVASIEATRFAQTANSGAGYISNIRTEAVLYRTPFVIAPTQSNTLQKGYQRKALDIPDDWVVSGTPLYITASGLCSGGVLTLANPDGRQARYDFAPPLCKAKRIPISNTAS